MLKRRLIALSLAIAITVAATGASTIVADSLGMSVTSTAQACGGTSTGGGC